MIRIGEITFVVKNGRPYIQGPRTSNELPLPVATLIDYAVNLRSEVDNASVIKNDESKKDQLIEELKAQILTQSAYVLSDSQEFKQFTLPTRINVNHATAAVLDLLPGIGAVSAGQIVRAREEKPFIDFTDLQERTDVTLKSEVAELIEF